MRRRMNAANGLRTHISNSSEHLKRLLINVDWEINDNVSSEIKTCARTIDFNFRLITGY